MHVPAAGEPRERARAVDITGRQHVLRGRSAFLGLQRESGGERPTDVTGSPRSAQKPLVFSGAGAPCPPAGRDWSWRCRWRLRQSFDDDGGAATSSKSEWLIVDGSAMRELWCASLEERSHSLSYTSGGHDSCP